MRSRLARLSVRPSGLLLALAVALAVAGGVAAQSDPLHDPDSDAANRRAPDEYRAEFRTTAGAFVVEVQRAPAPLGADRFYNLVRIGFFDDTYVYRVIDGSLVQFGIHGDPEVTAIWSWAEIPDDPLGDSNRRGTIAFAAAGPGTRTTQVFINTRDNIGFDEHGFVPFGRVVEGMDVVDSLYSGYGDGPPLGDGPDPGLLEDRGNAYVESDFPKLDRIVEARIR